MRRLGNEQGYVRINDELLWMGTGSSTELYGDGLVQVLKNGPVQDSDWTLLHVTGVIILTAGIISVHSATTHTGQKMVYDPFPHENIQNHICKGTKPNRHDSQDWKGEVTSGSLCQGQNDHGQEQQHVNKQHQNQSSNNSAFFIRGDTAGRQGFKTTYQG